MGWPQIPLDKCVFWFSCCYSSMLFLALRLSSNKPMPTKVNSGNPSSMKTANKFNPTRNHTGFGRYLMLTMTLKQIPGIKKVSFSIWSIKMVKIPPASNFGSCWSKINACWTILSKEVALPILSRSDGDNNINARIAITGVLMMRCLFWCLLNCFSI